MQSKSIIMQVSEETAEVMEGISGQLFEESEARFDEILEAVEGSIEKIENLYTDFTGYVGNYEKQATSNQMEVIGKFVIVSEALDSLKIDVREQAIQSNSKIECLIEIVADVHQLVKTVSQNISEVAESASTFEADLLQKIASLAEDLKLIQKFELEITKKLDADDSDKKLTAIQERISGIEREITQNASALSGVSDALNACNIIINQLLSSARILIDNDEKSNAAIERTAEGLNSLFKENEQSSTVMLEKMAEIVSRLDTVSHSIQRLSNQQIEIVERQAELDRDVQYLKLPFYKRWFTKG